MPVRELLARTSSIELAEWMAYERLTGPLDGRERGDISASIIAATVANAGGAKLKAKDFQPVWHRRKKSPEDMWKEVMQLNAQMGGTVADGNAG